MQRASQFPDAKNRDDRSADTRTLTELRRRYARPAILLAATLFAAMRARSIAGMNGFRNEVAGQLCGRAVPMLGLACCLGGEQNVVPDRR
jgi:hypothetical protein